MIKIRPAFTVCTLILVAGDCLAQRQQLDAPAIAEKHTINGAVGKKTWGRFRVFENKSSKVGRQIHLDFVVLHATGPDPKPDPFFFFVGGPGQAAATIVEQFSNHWVRKNRDIVLINQRGTGGDNQLAFEMKTEGDTLQQFLGSLWADDVVKSNLERLSKNYDLSMYSTPTAMDDINDFRKAMGYGKINIAGGSYGTRACLVYIRRHGETVRTATLAGCAPIEFRNPLYHAEGGQRALDMIFDEVAANDKYRAAFGDLRKKFKTILERLDRQPASVQVTNASTGTKETILLDRSMFETSVRFMMYYTGNSRRLPTLLCDAYEGEYKPFVLRALRQNIGLRTSLAMGMLLSVTTAEDVVRIDPDEIEPLTKDTFTGPGRVLDQMRAANVWPKSKLPANYGDPVRSDVQTLVLSGSIDPVTPPKWGETVHRNFPNSIHVVVPTAHDIGGSCVEHIKQQFLDSGRVAELDTSCVRGMKLPPLQLPAGSDD